MSQVNRIAEDKYKVNIQSSINSSPTNSELKTILHNCKPAEDKYRSTSNSNQIFSIANTPSITSNIVYSNIKGCQPNNNNYNAPVMHNLTTLNNIQYKSLHNNAIAQIKAPHINSINNVNTQQINSIKKTNIQQINSINTTNVNINQNVNNSRNNIQNTNKNNSKIYILQSPIQSIKSSNVVNLSAEQYSNILLVNNPNKEVNTSMPYIFNKSPQVNTFNSDNYLLNSKNNPEIEPINLNDKQNVNVNRNINLNSNGCKNISLNYERQLKKSPFILNRKYKSYPTSIQKPKKQQHIVNNESSMVLNKLHQNIDSSKEVFIFI